MNLLTPPEIADGGYWYVVSSVVDPEDGSRNPGPVPGAGWCAWYASGLAVVRCPNAVDGLATTDAVSVDEVLLAAGVGHKPYGRVGGL